MKKPTVWTALFAKQYYTFSDVFFDVLSVEITWSQRAASKWLSQIYVCGSTRAAFTVAWSADETFHTQHEFRNVV